MPDRFPAALDATPALFRELEERPRTHLERVLRDFGRLAGDDRSTTRLRRAAEGDLDLDVAAHRIALLVWLRAWGCRHLRVADTRRSSIALAAWWRGHRAQLPPPTRALTDLTDPELAAAAAAFGALAAAPAAWRAAAPGRWSVAFGETAAAKALFAIRPLAFPPWDAPIREALGLATGAGYATYLVHVAHALRRLADRLHVEVADVPAKLGRPGSSPPRLVDEYLWMRVNRPSGRGRGETNLAHAKG